ncbi:Hypothetical protein NTJ_15796 [Nesidiocoris tenuis]|uniref:Uncharacterized protein n=1 Tax=Nesidiocoris tenuis TaxID=355587 RepID=A0ABN7BGT2_9HEMI|nr:Hypothetical protein NTJ_15796 [Nesidiocoris tenuis]
METERLRMGGAVVLAAVLGVNRLGHKEAEFMSFSKVSASSCHPTIVVVDENGSRDSTMNGLSAPSEVCERKLWDAGRISGSQMRRFPDPWSLGISKC